MVRAPLRKAGCAVTSSTRSAPIWTTRPSRMRSSLSLPVASMRGLRYRQAAPVLASGPLFLDLVPDQRSDIGAAEILDGTDAGRRGDVDLRQKVADHVDADEQQAALAQRRAEPRADLALARGEVGGRRYAAAHHVGAQVVRRRHAIDRAGELAVDQNDALVAVLHRGQEFLHHPRLAEHGGEQIVERAEI